VVSVCLADEAPPLREAVIEITVNSQIPGDMFVVLREGADRLWLDANDFATLRLRPPAVVPRVYAGRNYLPLSALAGLRLKIDEAQQSADILLPASAFVPTHVSAAARAAPVLTAASPGAFLNYEISAQRVAGENAGGVTTELGIFGGAGVLTSTQLARELGVDQGALRLDTAFTHDFPTRLERLTVGDAISDAGSWGSSVHFGGISWGKNFSLRPDLVTTPLLAASGSAVVPSTVDIFVNNQKISSESLPPGPFIIDQLPAVTGAGEVSVVVRDALGQEQLLTQPFYTSIQQLAAGLSQYQIDAGKLRADYAIASDHYGSVMVDGTYRRGLSNALTIEGHGEYLAHGAHSAGFSVAAALKSFAVVNATVAAGGDAAGHGSLVGAGVERRADRFSFVASRTYASADYNQVASYISPTLQFRIRDIAQIGFLVAHATTFNLAFARQTNYTATPLQTTSLGVNWDFGRHCIVNLAATRTNQAGIAASSFFLTFSYTLGHRASVLLSGNGGSGPGSPDNELSATYVQSAPIGMGTGYRVGASSHGNYDADWRDQTAGGDVEFEAARNQGVAGVSGYFSGAFTLLDGTVRAARQVNDSFAVIDVAGIPDVPVMLENQVIAHTDRDGRALIHNLLPYQNNRISIEPTDLPLDTTIAARTMVVAPRFRTGVVARFPVEHVAGGTFRLVTPDGKPVPAGAQVRFKGNEFPVSYDGMTYVTGFDHGLAGEAHWENSRCRFRLDPPPPNDPLPNMGTVICRL